MKNQKTRRQQPHDQQNKNQTIYASPSLWRRFAAMVYDLLLVTAVSILYGALAVAVNLAMNGLPTEGERVSWGNWGILVFAGWLLTIAGFFCFFWCKTGQTLGMKTWRMKMFKAHTLELPGLTQCAWRCLLAPVSLLFAGAGYWYLYLRTDRQTLHDQLTQTRVLLIKKDQTN